MIGLPRQEAALWRQVFLRQAAFFVLALVGAYVVVGPAGAIAAAYGGGAALLLALVLAWQVLRLNSRLVASAPLPACVALLIAGFAVRLVLVVSLLGFGLGHLELQPLPLLVAFALVYLGYFFKPSKQSG